MEAMPMALDQGSTQTTPMPLQSQLCCDQRAGMGPAVLGGGTVWDYFLQPLSCVLTTLATVKRHHCLVPEPETRVPSAW